MIAKKIYLSVLPVTNWNLNQLVKREYIKQPVKSTGDAVLKINVLLKKVIFQ